MENKHLFASPEKFQIGVPRFCQPTDNISPMGKCLAAIFYTCLTQYSKDTQNYVKLLEIFVHSFKKYVAA